MSSLTDAAFDHVDREQCAQELLGALTLHTIFVDGVSLRDVLATPNEHCWANLETIVTWPHDPHGLYCWKDDNDQPVATHPFIKRTIETLKQRHCGEAAAIIDRAREQLIMQRKGFHESSIALVGRLVREDFERLRERFHSVQHRVATLTRGVFERQSFPSVAIDVRRPTAQHILDLLAMPERRATSPFRDLRRTVRIGTPCELTDVYTIASVIMDPAGKMQAPAFDSPQFKSIRDLIVVIILHALYSAEITEKSLAKAIEYAATATFITEALTERLGTYPHDPDGRYHWKTAEGEPTRTHPFIVWALRLHRFGSEDIFHTLAVLLTYLRSDRCDTSSAHTA